MVRLWPTLPIAIDFWISNDGKGTATPDIPHKGWYHTLTELEHPDRVSSIRVVVEDFRSEDMAEVVQRTFPVLTAFALRLVKLSSSPSRYVLGWICPTFTGSPPGCHSISDIPKIYTDSQGSCQARPSQYTPGWVHSGGDDGCESCHVDQT